MAATSATATATTSSNLSDTDNITTVESPYVRQYESIEMSSEERLAEVLKNIVKMLTNRGLLDKQNLDKNISKLVSTKSDQKIYKINLDNQYDEKIKNKELIVRVIPQKITSVSKTSEIIEFLNSVAAHPNIIVPHHMSSKAVDVITENYKFTEIFLEKELLINIVDSVLVPKHTLLTKEQMEEFMEEYAVRKKNLLRILVTDPIARYYRMHVGDICRIDRPNNNTAYDRAYRIVIPKH